MDTLTFNSPIVLRHLTFSEARKMPIDVITLSQVLKGLDLTMDRVRLLPHSTLPHSLLIAVHRHVHALRLRLPRTDQGSRSQDGLKAREGL